MYVLENKANGSYAFQQVAVTTGVREKGYVAVTLPPAIDVAKTPVVVSGAYNLLAKLNNSEEEE